MNNDGSNSVLINAKNKKVAQEYSVLLDSIEIPNNVLFKSGLWCVEVAVSDNSEALNEIYNYEKSGRIEKSKSNFSHIRFQKVGLIQLLVFPVLLMIFHAVIFYYPEFDFIKKGRASASAITEGELYRAVTALTLHGDVKHLFSNIIFGGIAVFSLSTLTGTGYGLMLFLFSGFLGNVLNAFYYGSAHNSIGASTAVFGTIGALAGLQFFEKFRERKTRAWIPFGAALGLLAMLGSSENTDVLAHLFGFICGISSGLFFGKIYSERAMPGEGIQNFLVYLFYILIAVSWLRGYLNYFLSRAFAVVIMMTLLLEVAPVTASTFTLWF